MHRRERKRKRKRKHFQGLNALAVFIISTSVPSGKGTRYSDFTQWRHRAGTVPPPPPPTYCTTTRVRIVLPGTLGCCRRGFSTFYRLSLGSWEELRRWEGFARHAHQTSTSPPARQVPVSPILGKDCGRAETDNLTTKNNRCRSAPSGHL